MTLDLDDAFFELHRDLSREGPGSDASTRDAIARLPPLGDTPRVLDVGCGPGAQALVLARTWETKVVALDPVPSFLEQVRRRAEMEGLADRIETREGSLLDVQEAEAFDLVWSEGALYFVGIERALGHIWDLLAPGGVVAFSDLVRTVDDVPPAVRAAFEPELGTIVDVDEGRDRVRQAGFIPVDAFVLPRSDWTEGYYGPLMQRVERLEQGGPSSALAAHLVDARAEAELYAEHGHTYSYAFYIGQKPRE